MIVPSDELKILPHPSILEVENLSIYYRERKVLNRINFVIQQHTITSIFGPSGVGKTTLLRSLNSLLDEDPGYLCEGMVRFNGQDIRKSRFGRYALRRSIGMMFQRPVTYPISIFKNVAFGVQYLALAKRREIPMIVEQMLREVYLWDEVKDRLDESALELSIGQQQRLSLARSLAVSPEVILMDEPTSALDIKAAKKIEELIVELKQRRTIILVTHQLAQAKNLSDRILCLKPSSNGASSAYFGPPDDLHDALVQNMFGYETEI